MTTNQSKEFNELNNKAMKRKKLRHNEYYNLQPLFDNLYKQSKSGATFKHLYDIIISRENILLAYRNIKANRGSKTRGSDNQTILEIQINQIDTLIDKIRNKLTDYKPKPVRRVYIPKMDGSERPLGIPTIEDRIIQQAFLQVLEPICEAKFHNDSYGFRPNRSTQHAIAKCYNYINISKMTYVVDVDIKGFFDNVDHSKLLKQIWSLGIRDKRVISIISKMLKTPIIDKKTIIYPTKGTPQGGILSPLLANIVLNELDWWISSQWLDFPAKMRKSGKGMGKLSEKDYASTSTRLNSLRTYTKLKQCFIVRYADDFKIFTNNYENANKLFIATKMWLKERLNLEISEDKSKVVNLKRNYSNFLGLKIKAKKKFDEGKVKYVTKSLMADKQKERILKNIITKVEEVSHDKTPNSMYKLNSLILGTHNYYKIATHVNESFSRIENRVYKKIKHQWIKRYKCAKRNGVFSLTYLKHYEKYRTRKQFFISKIALYPISGVNFKRPTIFNSKINSYTMEGRELIHKNLMAVDYSILRHIMENPVINRSVEYNDNRISLYTAQGGKCAITGLQLTVGNMHCHHKTPRFLGGNDKYNNLIYLHSEIHMLVHTNNDRTQERIMNQFVITPEQLKKINNLRQLVGNCNITLNRKSFK